MRTRCATWLGIAGILATAACGGSTGATGGGGTATAVIAGRTFNVSNVAITIGAAEDDEPGYFKIDGEDAANPDKDCLPGLSGGLALYGDLPANITTLADLAGRELPFEFSGDGDDANLCFVGSNGLLGVNTGTVRFTTVAGNKVTFEFSGSFTVYDGEGGESGPVDASGRGTAHASK